MHNQHAGLSETLAAQRIAERHEQAAQARLARSAGRSRRRRRWWLACGWWRLARRPSATAQPAVRLPAGHAYRAGDGFIDPGGGHVHMLRNETNDIAAETIAVQLLPKDAARRIPADAPRGCPS